MNHEYYFKSCFRNFPKQFYSLNKVIVGERHSNSPHFLTSYNNPDRINELMKKIVLKRFKYLNNEWYYDISMEY